MGYNRQKAQTVWALDFDAYPGLTVRARKPNFLGLRAAAAALPVLNAPARARVTDLQYLDAMNLLLDAFAMALVGWTLEEGADDRPVPATKQALERLDLEFLLDITGAWADATTTQPAAAAPAEPEPPEPPEVPEIEAELPMEVTAA
jgi:hypothetical protein